MIRRWFLNPYVQIGINEAWEEAVIPSVSEGSVRAGAAGRVRIASPTHPGPSLTLGVTRA